MTPTGSPVPHCADPCARCKHTAAHHHTGGGCDGFTGLAPRCECVGYAVIHKPPTKRQACRAKLNRWIAQRRAPTLASASRIVVVTRPRLTATGAGIVAWIALGAACLVAVASGFGEGWIALTVVSICASLWSFYVSE